ncbi:transposase, partial [Pseudoalteromonas sp. TB43-MNA-CIBAN-0091]
MKNELALKQRIAELEKLLAQKDAQIAALEERWSLAQQKQFGKSAEGFAGQGELFNEVEEIVEEVEAEQQSISYTRKKPVRKPLPKDLPRE